MPFAPLPSHLFAPRLPLSPALLDDVAAIEGGDRAAMRRVLERTSKLVGPRDVTAAAGGIGVEAFAESLLDPVDDLSAVSDADAEHVLASIMNAAYSESDLGRALRALQRAFDQPALSDLIFWPNEELTPAEVVSIARTKKGTALVPWLDPQCGVPSETTTRAPSATALAHARRVLMTLVEDDALELAFGEAAAEGLAQLIDAGVGADVVAERMLDLPGIDEVYADESTLRDAIDATMIATNVARR